MGIPVCYGDKIGMIKRGGSSRNGKLPDTLVEVIFLRLTGDKSVFDYLYSSQDSMVGVGEVKNIVSINGKPLCDWSL